MDVKGANRMCCPLSMVQRPACGKSVGKGGALIKANELWSHQKPTPICDHNSFLAFSLEDRGDKVAKVVGGAPSSQLKFIPRLTVGRPARFNRMRA